MRVCDSDAGAGVGGGDVVQMLRLPPAFARQVLSCAQHRNLFVKMLLDTTLSSLTEDCQVIDWLLCCAWLIACLACLSACPVSRYDVLLL